MVDDATAEADIELDNVVVGCELLVVCTEVDESVDETVEKDAIAGTTLVVLLAVACDMLPEGVELCELDVEATGDGCRSRDIALGSSDRMIETSAEVGSGAAGCCIGK